MELLQYAVVARTMLPIFLYNGDGLGEPIEFCGTGFVIGRDVLVTCRHCVATPPKGHRYMAVTVDAAGQCVPLMLENVEPDEGGADLATATVKTESPLPLRLGDEKYVLFGHDVWTFGYPYTEKQRLQSGEFDFTLHGRLLRGHVTRTFPFNHPTLGKVNSYELDFPAPMGLSGAPLVLRGSFDVVGVVYYNHDVEMITRAEHRLEKSGEVIPLLGVVSFGLAHVTPTLRRLRGKATAGLPLAEYLSA